MDKEIIGIFHSEEEAIRKVEELETQGYDASDIYAVAKDEDDVSMVRGRTNIDVKSKGGNWFDRFVGFITGEEPVREALHNAGLDGPEMDDYYHEIDNGGILLYVDKEYGRIHDSLEEHMNDNPMNVHNADTEMHTESNFVPHSEVDATSQTSGMNTSEDTAEEARMQLYEEKLRVDKEQVESGEVRVRKNVVEEEQSFDVPVSREEVYIERRPADEAKAMDEASAAFEEDGESIRIPLKEEHVEVTKKPVVNEELIVGKKKVEDTETVRETVRREEADIDEMYGEHRDDSENMDNSNINTAARINEESDFGNASTLDARMNEGQPSGNNVLANDSGINVQNDPNIDERSKLDEELEKRRAEVQAKNYNPYSGENRNHRL
ncbi:YsnF/AvaK domain-containing protein [Siminovitchia fortis]|nr:YsnF/AvaK domain-containing protein [Siminovitchia fortis]WHY81942.1 YsnF/AvaK domain-containing protein [Siminovitchia fortis]